EEHPVGKGRAEDRREVAVADQEVARQCGVEGQRSFRVVADGEDVVPARAKEAVHRAVVVRHAALVVGGVGVRVAAACVIRTKGKSGVSGPVTVGVTEAGLFSVGAGEPAQKVVEAAILHRHDDDVFNTRGIRRWLRGSAPLRYAGYGRGTRERAQKSTAS